MESVLDTLPYREKRVIKLAYGFEDGREWSMKDIGEKFGVHRSRSWQIANKVLRKLRYPTRSRRLRDYDYMDGDYGNVMPIKYSESPSSAQTDPSWKVDINPYSIGIMFFSDERQKNLTASGIREIADFFSASPSEIAEGWNGYPFELAEIVRTLLIRLGSGDGSKAESDPRLLRHITNGILYKEGRADANLTEGERKDMYRKAYEELMTFFSSNNLL